MSYSFGWWDFVEVNGEPQMVCRDSDERVVMVGDLADPWLSKASVEHPNRPADRWKRFEYRHEDFWFPLIVNWVPEEGRILVDYNLSSELWRLETDAETEYPPYGGWVRVDDMVPDAFWCWPEFLDSLITQKSTFLFKYKNGLFLQGGYIGKVWDRDFISIEAFPLPENSPETGFGKAKLPKKNNKLKEFYSSYINEPQLKRLKLTSLSFSLAADWSFFIGTPNEIQQKMNDAGISIQLPWAYESSVYGEVIDFKPFLDSGFPIIFNSELNRVLQFIDIEKGYFNIAKFRYWKSCDSCHEVSVQMGFQFDEMRSFSLFPSCLKWSGISHLPHDYSNLDCSSIDLELSEEFQIKREITNAFLLWTGTKEKLIQPNKTWDSYDNKLESYKFFWPVEVVESAVGSVGGKRCKGRARITSLAKNLKKLGNE